jgi:WD40 repeat protein
MLTRRARLALLLPAGLVCWLCLTTDVLADKEKEVFKTKAIYGFLTPDGKILAANSDTNVRLVDIAAKKSALLGKSFANVTLSPDGKAVATHAEGKVKVFDVSPVKARGSFTIDGNAALCIALSPEGKWFAHGTLNTLVLLDAAKGEVKRTFKDLGGQPMSAAFSADGKYLACGTDSGGKKLWVWDVESGKAVQSLECKDIVSGVAFSPDSKYVAGCSADEIKVWDLASGKPAHSFKGTREKYVRSLAFGKEGKILVTGASDGLVTIWDLASDKALDTIKQPKDVFRVSLSADARVLSVSLEGDETKVYDLSDVVGK